MRFRRDPRLTGGRRRSFFFLFRCDRILWRGAGLKQKRYDRCESRLSDHRPVRALFEVEVGAPRRNLNSLRSFFLSERFDGGRSAAADLLREDGTASSARFGDTI